jgi:hypothetical protein
MNILRYTDNEGLVFFIKHGEVESFLADMNLRMIDYLDNEVQHKYLLDDYESLIGRMTGNFRFVCAAPMK